MVTLILFFLSFFIIYIIIRLVKTSEIKRRWAGAYRHIVILILAWIAFATLVSLVMLLDLFEGNHYSISNFLRALRTPWILLTTGLIVLLFTLWPFKASRDQQS